VTPTFKDFALLPSLLKTLLAYKIAKPSEIQARAIPALLKGRSVVGVSETGSGKTLAFALPILHLLKEMESPKSFTGPVANESLPRAAVIVPSRELGEQVAKAFKLFTHDTRLRVRTVLGGTEMAVARKNVAGAFEVLVATPGRIIARS
jgi:superfamily II DNA/RNA helicase